MLHYDEYGRPGSPALLLLHGAAALDTFSQQYDLAEKYRLIVPHLPGAGENAGLVYRPEETVQALLELISSLGLEKPAVMGHSLGAQLSVLLLCKAPDLFSCGIFLSAWVNPRKKTVAAYSRLATLSSAALKWDWLVRLQGRYWHFTPAQAQRMAAYSRNITPEVYRSFFTNTLDLARHPEYQEVRVPMLAICGSREVRDMRASLTLLGENPCCETVLLPGCDHDFPMRKAEVLNPMINRFLEKYHPA